MREKGEQREREREGGREADIEWGGEREKQRVRELEIKSG